MTFLEYYKKVIELSGVEATKDYVKILWHYAYTIEQAVNNLKTIKD